jgi:D-glycero-D-manno-heptose 1,7-bisphosphate phosphatase
MPNKEIPLKLIILDRDGVINQDSDQYVKSIDEWIPLPRSIEAIAMLSKAGYEIHVATNQSGLARGYFTEDTLSKMHDKMLELVNSAGGKIQSIKFCPHGPDDNCKCRKPNSGMFEEIASELKLSNLAGSFTVGDSSRDLIAGSKLHSAPVLVKTGKGERTITKGDMPANTVIFDDLMSFAQHLLSS